MAPSGWLAKEPLVSPVHEVQGAGLDSVVDNTMRFSPNPPRWGKTREISPAENIPPLRILAPDTLSRAKVRSGALSNAVEHYYAPRWRTAPPAC